MNAAIEAVLDEVDGLRRALKNGPGKQIQADSDCERIRRLCGNYFSARAGLAETGEAAGADTLFKQLYGMSRGHPSRGKVVDMLTDAKQLLVRLEEGVLVSATAKHAGRKTATDRLIIETLTEVCPSAAASYAQALEDLSAEKRLSWRGPATDLRESLRETLDEMVPDDEVVASPGFKLEKDAHRPTMKQKVKYILKKRGMPSGAMAAPETAVQGIEDIVGGLTRSVYTRSNLSTHTPTTKEEVVRLHAWVRLVFCDLLEVPPE